MNTRIIKFLFGTTIASAIALLLLVLPVPARTVSSAPAVLLFNEVVVNTTTDEFGTGAGCSLREAIKALNDSVDFGGCARIPISGPKIILLPLGIYTLTIAGAVEDLDATGDLDIRTGMIISATGATAPTVVGGASWTDRIFHILTGTVTIKGLAIRGGNAGVAYGGGVRIESSQSLTFNDGTISGNSGVRGGGIYNEGTLTLTNVTLSGNSGGFAGGGIINLGTATLTNITLSGNTATDGGGIYNDGALVLTNVTFSGNSSPDGGGGGIDNNNGTATLTNVTLSGNSAPDGGGIENINSTATLTNVTLSGNSASAGGGIYNYKSTATLTNVTLSGNSAPYGGDIFHFSSIAGKTITLKNTIVANSPSGVNCYQFNLSLTNIASTGFNLSSDTSCTSYFNQASDQNNKSAQLGPLANNGGFTLTQMPLPPIVNGSGPIDNGTCVVSTDQRGVSRPQGAACDIGAVERKPGDFGVYLNLPLIMR